MANRTLTTSEHDAQDSRNEWLAQFTIDWDSVSVSGRVDAGEVHRRITTRLAALAPHPDVLDVDRDEVRMLIMAARYVTK